MNVKKLIEQMLAAGKDIIQPAGNQRQWRGPTPAKKARAGTTNHGQGESKTRRKMAAKSRKINRRRK